AYNVSQTTGIGVNDLMNGMRRAAPAIDDMGLSFDEAAVMMGNLHKAGVDGESMMERMTRNLGKVAKAGESPRETFERVTREVEAFVEAGDRGAATELAKEAWGSRAGQQFVKGIADGTLAIEDLIDVSSVGTDTIAEAAEENRSFAEHWQMFKNEIMAELAPAAEWSFEQISYGMSWIIDNAIPVVKDLAHWLGENSGWLTPLAATIGGIVAAIKIWSMVQGVLNAVMAANPIGLIVLAIVGLVAAFVTAYKRSEKFRAVVDAVWQGVKDAVSVVWDLLKTKVFQPLVNCIKRMWERFQTFKYSTTYVWDTVKN